MNVARAVLLVGMSVYAIPALAQEPMQTAHAAPPATQSLPTQSGQSAFGAIHEILDMLEADPNTDWSKVNIGALRAHLIDMDNVTLHAVIAYTPTATGENIHVSGDGAVRDSIQRMVMMHAAMAGETPDWQMYASRVADGALVKVIAKTPSGLAKMKALGLIGMMAEGMHHARHHMMLARGTM